MHAPTTRACRITGISSVTGTGDTTMADGPAFRAVVGAVHAPPLRLSRPRTRLNHTALTSTLTLVIAGRILTVYSWGNDGYDDASYLLVGMGGICPFPGFHVRTTNCWHA